ncbi:hypothetical protein QUF90_19540 [Desulfococcaceae bacterium HSG9]|nr:hypothetical protein [Desulfococcaceae bacterium HSG9]
MTKQNPDYDSPWKEIIEIYFEEFMAFFFPKAHGKIDWSAGYTFMDKELQKVARDAETGRRVVDKLARITLLDGKEAFVLAHIEVQGQSETGFRKRMYVYNYRLFDNYGYKVASLAILTDNRKNWRPGQYGYKLFGCEVRLKFPIVKLLDYKERFEELQNNPSPFAIVVMAHLKAMETNKNPQSRLRWKVNLVKMMYERGYSKKDILELWRFIDWLMILPGKLELLFEKEISEYKEENKMRYVTSIERRGIKKGEQQIISHLIKTRFGDYPEWVMKKINEADTEKLLDWSERLLSAETIEEIFEA